ncbi:MAG: 2-amino-4-hydroxy-6-hydroxymethyldihydropteridine diphosphokinase [Magnetococcales bacterium]|nr:2-amino-4-hydroxy-6-hydroxymethyldihydropteridine diphosphokinase [Magnetococcales bacterium]
MALTTTVGAADPGPSLKTTHTSTDDATIRFDQPRHGQVDGIGPFPGSAIAWIGVGSNIHSPLGRCRRAIALLAQNHQIRLLALSSWYHTQPVGFKHQPWFINAVACLATSLLPLALLRLLQRVECRLGRNRRREFKNGPRPMDLDLLMYDQCQLHHPRLTLPHPRITRRRFVLVPLAELSPTLLHPGCGKTIDLLLKETDDKSRVEPMAPPGWR